MSGDKTIEPGAYITGTCLKCEQRVDSRHAHICIPPPTIEERISSLERAVARMESRAQAGRPTPPGVVPPMGGQACADCKTLGRVLHLTSGGRFVCATCLPRHMGLLCKHCNEPLSNGESHGRGHCVISDAEDPPVVAREQCEAWERTETLAQHVERTEGRPSPILGLLEHAGDGRWCRNCEGVQPESCAMHSRAKHHAHYLQEQKGTDAATTIGWADGARDPLGVQRGVEQAPKPGPATLLGEATTLAYHAEALAFEALHANALSVATQDIHSARALLVEAVSALKRATAWTENSK